MNVSDDDVLDGIRDVRAPVATATEVAEFLPIGQRAVLNRLTDLHEEGRVERKDVGARSTVWWVPDAQSSHERSDSFERTDDRVFETQPDAGDAGEESVDDVPEEIDALDLPGSGSRLRERREAVRECYAYLREHGEGKRSVFESEVYPEHSGGYESAYSWWNNCVIEGLKQLADVDDALEVPDYSGRWRYHD